MWAGVNWTALGGRYEKDYGVDISSIISMAKDVEDKLETEIIDGDENLSDVLAAKSQLWVIFRKIITLFSSETYRRRGSDKMVLIKMQEDFGRMIKRFDEHQDRQKFDITSSAREISSPKVIAFANELKEILYGDVYESLKSALDKKPKDKIGLMYALYEILHRNMAFFGAVTRTKDKARVISVDSVEQGAEEMLGDDGQKKLGDEYEDRLKSMMGKK